MLFRSRRQIRDLQEGLRKQAVDTDRRFLQMVDQMAQLAGLVKRIEGLMMPAPTGLGSWNRLSGEGALSSSLCGPEVRGACYLLADVAIRVSFPRNAPAVVHPTQSP